MSELYTAPSLLAALPAAVGATKTIPEKEEDKEDWFFGDMMRTEAEELLSHSANDQGSFLVRHSNKHKKLVLSVKIFDEELLVYQYKHFSIR